MIRIYSELFREIKYLEHFLKINVYSIIISSLEKTDIFNLRATDASISPEDASLSVKDASMSAKDATMSAKRES